MLLKQLILFCFCFITISFSGCTMLFYAYIRNATNTAAVIDVKLLSKSSMKTLPNRVKVADKVVVFKSGFRQNFYKTYPVTWIDTTHFSFVIMPGTSIDLTDVAGKFVNAHPREDVLVTVTLNYKIDTLINGYRDFRHEKFGYKNVGVSVPVLYYDVVEK